MAKNALLGVLESTVGKYVQNLDAQSLNVAVWSGKIQLSSLTLDVDAVNAELSRRAHSAPNLALPIRVVRGSFEELRVEVPWARIASRPVVIKASGLNVVVEPHDHLRGVTDVAAKRRREVRREEVVRGEEERGRRNALWRLTALDVEGGGENGTGSGGEDGTGRSGGKDKQEGGGFTANLIRRIIENLQIEIESFHVSLRGCGAKAGVVLGGLYVATTDEDGVKKYVDRTDTKSKFLHKSVTISGLGAYVDAASYDGTGTDGPQLALPGAGGSTSPALQQHSYILSPMTFEASIRQSDHEGHRVYPKYLVKSKVPLLSATLSRTQLELTNRIAAALAPDRNVVRPLFPEYRPNSDIMGGGAKEWWKYAVRCIGRLNRRRSWAEYLLAYRKRKRYIPLYMRYAKEDAETWIKPLSDAERRVMEGIEQDTSISTEGIMMWRNIADAQAEQEDERRQEAFITEMMGGGTGLGEARYSPPRDKGGGRPSLRSAGRSASIYSSARMHLSVTDSSGLLDKHEGDEVGSGAPITLSPEELRDIEAVMFASAAADVSSDSKLYDLSFELTRFKVNMIDQGYLASLDMGKAVVTFTANADGSFNFGSTMRSLLVSDQTTLNTLFPSVVRTLDSPSSSSELVTAVATSQDAFEFHLAKSKVGDQELKVKMAALEIVASQELIKGIKDFFTFAPEPSANKAAVAGPTAPRAGLIETSSGDIFFDANEDHPSDNIDHQGNIIDMTAGAAASAAAIVSDALATSIVDAWNAKRESKKAWTIELDLHAPVLVLPQSSVDPAATCIVADLGRFVIVFGTNAKPPAKVKEWFERRAANDKEKPAVDYGTFDMQDFRCLISKVGAKDWIVASTANDSHGIVPASSSARAIFEPLSLSLCIGLESVADKGDDAGTCMVGILPSISLCASLPQIYDVLSVINTWSTFFGTLGNGPDDEAGPAAVAPVTEINEPAIDLSQVTKQYLSRIHESRVGDNEKIYVELALQRISVKLLTHRGDGLEAHLVSIVATSRVLDDGSTSSCLAMGYFWILDSLQNDFPREQRLIAHSTLPRSAEEFAENDKYDVMDDLARRGAFDDDYKGASDLAEIVVSTSPETLATTIDGVFSSLHIDFNPLALRQILNDVTAVPDGDLSPQKQGEDGVDLNQSVSQDIISQGRSYYHDHRDTQVQSPAEDASAGSGSSDNKGSLHISARMGGFEILTRSPSDDQPLLRFAMTTSDISYDSYELEAKADVSLNNLIVEDKRDFPLRPSFRYILRQGKGETGEQDFFHVAYKQRGSSMDIGVGIGSPEIVLPSDVLVDMLEFWTAWSESAPQDEVAQNAINQVEGANEQGELAIVGSKTTNIDTAVGNDGVVDKSAAQQEDSEMSISVTTGSGLKVILVDVGNNQFGLGSISSSSKRGYAQSKLADTIVLQGKLGATIRMTGDSSDYELTWQDFQSFTAHGHKLLSPIQLLDPSELSAVYRTAVRGDINETEIKLWSLKSIDFTLSMEDLALLLSILGSFGDAFASSPDAALEDIDEDAEAKIIATKELSKRETESLMRLSVALEQPLVDQESWGDSGLIQVPSTIDEEQIDIVAQNDETANGALSTMTKVNDEISIKQNASSMKIRIAFPKSTLTLINDLQGLDDGLFKLFVQDFLVAGEIQYPSSDEKHTTSSVPLSPMSTTIKPVLRLELSQVMTANYFDTHTSLWEPLLLQPWESSFNALRAPGKHAGSKRLQSTINIESDPCYISFSEKFLVSLGAASRMWSSYSFATSEAAVAEAGIGKLSEVAATRQVDRRSERNSSLLVRKSTAANAARSFVKNLPYLVENRSGLTASFELKGREETYRCDSGAREYFCFYPPKGDGIGGKRAYGQNVTEFKTLTLRIGDKSIKFQHLDAYLHIPRQAHDLGYGRHLFTDVIRKGRAICLVLSSHVSLYNRTSSVNFRIGFECNGERSDVGTAEREKGSKSTSSSKEGDVHGFSEALGIPMDLLKSFDEGIESVEIEADTAGENVSPIDKSSELSLIVSPILEEDSDIKHLCGTFVLPAAVALLEMAENDASMQVKEITCTGQDGDIASPISFTVRIVYEITLVGGHPCLSINIYPRTILENKVPVALLVRTSSRHAFSSTSYDSAQTDDEGLTDGMTINMLKPFEVAEIFSSDASFSASLKIGERPVAGNETGWSQSGPLMLPLSHRIASPIKTILPFVSTDGSSAPLNADSGDHLFVLESSELASFAALDDEKDVGGANGSEKNENDGTQSEATRRMCIVAMNFAVLHSSCSKFTLEEAGGPPKGRTPSGKASRSTSAAAAAATTTAAATFGAFALSNRRARLVLIPSPDSYFKLVHPALKNVPATSLSSTFRVKDVLFSGGGVQSSAILWDTSKMVSGFFAYRKFSSFGQSEIHIIPEFVVFNGTGSQIVLLQEGVPDLVLGKDGVAPLSVRDRAKGLKLVLRFSSIAGRTDKVRLDKIGTKVMVVRREDGTPIASISIQTEPGHSDSRLVIKVGSLKMSGDDERISDEAKSEELFHGDFFRFRARLAEFNITLNDTQQSVIQGPAYDKGRAAIESAFDIKGPDDSSADGTDPLIMRDGNVAQISFQRFTVDFQRIFKPNKSDGAAKAADGIDGANAIERSQLAIVIGVFQIKDCTEASRFPVVFDSSDTTASFFDLCIRLRGSFDSPLVKLECFDLNLSCIDGKANVITIKTDERFLWKLLDILNRIMIATSELAGVDMQLEWDEETGDYEVSTKEHARIDDLAQGQDFETYEISPSEKIYNVSIIRVSPLKLVVSFLREPDASRYGKTSGVIGANVINYFTTKMTFTVDRAQLNFAGYAARNVKGAAGQIISMLSTVYIARLKRKAFSLLTAVSLKDWNYLTSREDGEDGYVEGDLLRLTGNVAGRGAGLLLKRVGQGFDQGVRAVTGTIGDEIQNATELVGVGVVGAGVNSAVTGVGEGVGAAVKGAGYGTGKLVRGAVVGVGQAAGGVGGGAAKAVKGVGTAVVRGDANLALTGISEGATSAAFGVGQGVETLVMGTTDGVRTVGTGFTDGLKSLIRGFCYCCLDGAGEASEHGSAHSTT